MLTTRELIFEPRLVLAFFHSGVSHFIYHVLLLICHEAFVASHVFSLVQFGSVPASEVFEVSTVLDCILSLVNQLFVFHFTCLLKTSQVFLLPGFINRSRIVLLFNVLARFISLFSYDFSISIYLLQRVSLLYFIPLHYSLALCIKSFVIRNEVHGNVIEELALTVGPETGTIGVQGLFTRDVEGCAFVVIQFLSFDFRFFCHLVFAQLCYLGNFSLFLSICHTIVIPNFNNSFFVSFVQVMRCFLGFLFDNGGQFFLCFDNSSSNFDNSLFLFSISLCSDCFHFIEYLLVIFFIFLSSSLILNGSFKFFDLNLVIRFVNVDFQN